jgi:MFS superfamily sulfate permease-like transporter
MPRVPWALIVVVASIVASNALGWADSGIAVVGDVPAGLPVPGLPSVGMNDVVWAVGAGAALALVGLAEGLSAARLFAARGGYRIDADADLVATGAANLASGAFGGLGVAGSLSKTAAADRASGRTQMTGVTTAVLALVVIALFAPSLASLPLAVLSAVVVHAVWGLMDVSALRRYAAVRRLDLIAAAAGAVGVLSVFGLVYRSSRVEVDELGRIAKEKAAWGSLKDHPERGTIPGILIVRLSAPLFWVNAMTVSDEVLSLVDGADDLSAVVLDLEGTSVLDTTSADMLANLLDSLRRRDVDLYLVRVRYPVRVLLRRAGVMDAVGEDHVWHTISQGVKRARKDHGITTSWAPSGDFDPDRPYVPQTGEDEFGHRWSPFGS